jgi:hypothetical protein
MPTREELLQIANQKATEQAIQQIGNDYKANTELYYESLAAGKYDDAAYHLREARRLESEAMPYVQAAQQQQSQYTQGEQNLMRDYPQIVNDPKKKAIAWTAANNLIASKQKADPEADLWAYRNSGEYLSGIAHACDVLNSDGTESLEVASPNTALACCQSKYGPVTVEEYNQGVERLAQEKRAGKYPMSQT